MTDILIHIEKKNASDDDKGYAVYASNIVPRVGEILWVDKTAEQQEIDKLHEDFCKVYHLKVVDVIHCIHTFDSDPSNHHSCNTYVLVEETDDSGL